MLGEIYKKEFHPDNVITQLRLRAITPMNSGNWYHYHKRLYTSIVPNYSENRIKVPGGCYLRKFCPDGHKLLAFSQDQHSVEVFKFNGSPASQHMYDNPYNLQHSTEELFSAFFEHKFSIRVSTDDEVLNRECSIFLPDNEYAIVASSVNLPDEPFPYMSDTFKNNESLSPNNRFMLENYSLFLICLSKGYVADLHKFKCDKIFLSHNQGLSLCESKLAVLSAQHQTIHIFQIVSGSFIPLQEIGRFCYPDDNLFFDSVGYSSSEGYPYQPFLEKWINSLKHRFLCCIKRQAAASCTSDSLIDFYQRFDFYNSLRIWKMQLINEDTLLLKYAAEDVVTLKVGDPISQPAFFAFYDINSTRVIAVFENSSDDFLDIYENYADIFRSAVSHPLSYDTCCVSNCIYGRSLHMKLKNTIINARFGGVTEATKRLLLQVPICSQSFSSSPYLDLSLYRYDDKWISPLERPKPCGDTPVR
jgi:de-etiolated-1